MNSNVNIWGKSNPNQKVTIYSSWNNKSVKTKSNNNGEWIIKIQTNDYNGLHKLTISTNNDLVEINNILLGEVWFAGKYFELLFTYLLILVILSIA